MAARAVRNKIRLSAIVEDSLRQNRTRRVTRTKKQHVVTFRHRQTLVAASRAAAGRFCRRRFLRPHKRADELAFDLGPNFLRVKSRRGRKIARLVSFVDSRWLDVNGLKSRPGELFLI